MSFKEIFNTEEFGVYRERLTVAIDKKVQQLVTSQGVEGDVALKAEIKTLVWVRDQLPQILVGEEERRPQDIPPYGSEYDGKEQA